MDWISQVQRRSRRVHLSIIAIDTKAPPPVFTRRKQGKNRCSAAPTRNWILLAYLINYYTSENCARPGSTRSLSLRKRSSVALPH